MSPGLRSPTQRPGDAGPGPGCGRRPLPDPERVASARAKPEEGPRILFLSGGTALRELSRCLIEYTHASIHLVTPFDSGGSSAPLRAAFAMPAVGDLRNRLLALAPGAEPGAGALQQLLAERLPRAPRARLTGELQGIASGSDPRLAEIQDDARSLVCEQIGRFLRRAPADFDLGGASIGNLVLTGLYLDGHDIEAALSRLATLLGARGRVLPTVDSNLHLAARLADGARVVGQHRLTGKQHPPLTSRIEDLYLVETLDGDAAPVARPPSVAPDTLALIRAADLICYPMGSFYTSLLCNLLPAGVGRAIAQASCAKVYVPSLGRDPELVDQDAGQTVELLLAALRADAGPGTPTDRLLNAVLLDPDPACYALPPDVARIERSGAAVIRVPLAAAADRTHTDPQRMAEILVSLARDPRADGARR